MGPGTTLSFVFVLAVAGAVFVVFLIGLIAWSPWSRGPSGAEADLAASLAGTVHTKSGCTRQEGHDWFWCGTSYDWFDGWEGTMYRIAVDADDCWVATPGRILPARGAPAPRSVRFVERNQETLRGCIGSGATGHAVDGPGQIPRLLGG
jgi:hypothetical protein